MADDNRHSKAGLARAEALTPERRTEIAKQGAVSRWGYRATHKGNFKQDFGIDIDCHIIDDKTKTAVITQSDMGAAIGLVRRGNSLLEFLNGQKIAPYIGGELLEKLKNPIIFQGVKSAVNARPIMHGFDITILIDLCDAIIKAQHEGKLLERQLHIARQAQIIRTASAKQGIKQLAWAVAGYDPTREEIINLFKEYVAEEACRYKSEFPRFIFEGWCRLYNLRETKIHQTFSYWEPKHTFKKLVLEQIYFPIDNSEGAVLELILRAKADNPGGKRLFHYLTEKVGLSALRRQIGKVEGIQQLSSSKDEYETYFNRLFKKPPPH